MTNCQKYIISLIVFLISFSLIKTGYASISTGEHYTQVGNNKIYYRVAGHGQPTVIFSSGTGFPADGWFDSGIATKIAEKTQVFAYDRPFTFKSNQASKNKLPLTAQEIVTQLHQLLKQEKILPPYILVGHSFGGLYMLVYAREYPDEVAGLILLDASYGGQTPLPKQAIPIVEKLGNPQNPTPDNPLYNEMIGQTASFQQLKDSPPLNKKIPLIVMAATKHCLPIQWTKKLMCMTPDQEEAHIAKQREIYNMSMNHKFIIVKGDHNVFFNPDEASQVIDQIDTLLKKKQGLSFINLSY